MKKIFSISIVLLCINYSFSQVTFDYLDGEWLIKEVININDSSITRGKYVDKDEYLKFSFHKKIFLLQHLQ